MKVQLYFIGKTKEKYLRTGEEIYAKRLSHYLPVAVEILPDIRMAGKMSSEELKEAEGKLLLSRIGPEDRLVLLDEGGATYSSVELSRWMEKELQRPARRLVFAVGGAFGFTEAVYARADQQLSLSRMTFSHQMVRLFLLEQIYRAMTILRNEKYHNS
ncbi:23S rRNA (pseudouridine1915-N3)-methyltransferase [Neolewinella xylanilytica]|uniref:Ribosomal RNA large subunit methyltransferase H n=1 Tax=Neolewinella xylanilytica TaxID=1514080 RepID=A0A2S6I5T5_9BACT|nr:23S rRNA (pseudouridine(1915)-N(3))-methyltransferase RlmH [Neolewinella xylanilytica]PPK86523.1 23S rRNA (pseudouridine1915-N3)-methyltransferase [Neolewinella xylanilytica]